jgi:hypothetical protein
MAKNTICLWYAKKTPAQFAALFVSGLTPEDQGSFQSLTARAREARAYPSQGDRSPNLERRWECWSLRPNRRASSEPETD